MRQEARATDSLRQRARRMPGNARNAMGAIDVAPDFSYQLNEGGDSPDAEPAFDYAHRRTETADIYFVRNTQNRQLEAKLSFRVSGRTPELWTADDGATTPALVYSETKDGRTEIPLSFPPAGSIFIIFERPTSLHLVRIEKDQQEIFPSIRLGTGVFADGDSEIIATGPGNYVAIDSEGRKHSFTVPEVDAEKKCAMSWTLSFPSGWGAPESIHVDHFQSWTESTDPGIKYFSGTAVYRADLRVTAGLAAAGSQLWLQLGQVREIATVSVNGRAVQTLWRDPFAVRIDPLLHAGHNTIEIKVTNLWPNRLIGDLQPSATAQFTHTNVHAYTKDSPLLPSGILQPVTLQRETVLRWR